MFYCILVTLINNFKRSTNKQKYFNYYHFSDQKGCKIMIYFHHYKKFPNNNNNNILYLQIVYICLLAITSNQKITKQLNVNIKIKYPPIFQHMVKLTSIMLGISTAYILTSSFFFQFPQLLRKPNKFTYQIFNEALEGHKLLRISHRGSPRYTTQNTVQAFQKISDLSDMLQMDVCETSDKILVLHHDKTLMKSCGINRPISQVKFQDLPRYQKKIQLDFVHERYFETNNQKMPTLEKVFQKFQGMAMNIELKTPTSSAISSFVRLIHKYQRQHNTIVGIRSQESVHLSEYNLKMKLQDKNSEKRHPLLLFMSDSTVKKVYLAYFSGLLPFIDIKQASLQIPIYSEQFKEWIVAKGKKNGESQLKLKLGCRLLKVINYLSKPLIKHLAKRGVLSYGWVCNTEESLQRAQKMGVQGIMSDQPYQLNNFAIKFQTKKDKKQQQ